MGIEEGLIIPEDEAPSNGFCQTELPDELFQTSAVSYIPTNEADFKQKQREEDVKYIFDALQNEENLILGLDNRSKPGLEEILNEEKSAENINNENEDQIQNEEIEEKTGDQIIDDDEV